MQLFAVDGGADSMTGTAVVTVRVIDVNDNRPRFSKPLYEVFLTENTPPGTVVVTVDAFDDDEGQNGVIDFQFAVSTQESMASRVFSINNSTGQILVSVRLSALINAENCGSKSSDSFATLALYKFTYLLT